MNPDKFLADKGIVTEFPPQAQVERGAVRILTSAEFVRGFVPPDYALDGIIQRGFLYSFCGATGSGKTAIALLLLACSAIGRALGARDIIRGRGLMLVGENPDDVRARWIAQCEDMSIDPDEIDVNFIPGIFPIPTLVEIIRQKAATIGDLVQIVVDTGAAYFGGEDENSNRELGEYARLLRTLTTLPGRPAVIVNSHPAKGATTENLVPRGGGAFLAEVDGNLCCKASNKIAEVHWQGKFRGPDFEPVSFELATAHSTRLVNARGRQMPTVIARVIGEFERASKEAALVDDQIIMLQIIAETSRLSLTALAEKAGWRLSDGQTYKSRAQRAVDDLKRLKMIEKGLAGWCTTEQGRRVLKTSQK